MILNAQAGYITQNNKYVFKDTVIVQVFLNDIPRNALIHT